MIRYYTSLLHRFSRFQWSHIVWSSHSESQHTAIMYFQNHAKEVKKMSEPAVQWNDRLFGSLGVGTVFKESSKRINALDFSVDGMWSSCLSSYHILKASSSYRLQTTTQSVFSIASAVTDRSSYIRRNTEWTSFDSFILGLFRLCVPVEVRPTIPCDTGICMKISS